MTPPDFNIVLGRTEGVVVVSNAFKSFIFKLEVATSIFPNIFLQDCRHICCFYKTTIFYC